MPKKEHKIPTKEEYLEGVDVNKVKNLAGVLNSLNPKEVDYFFHCMNHGGLIDLLAGVSCALICQHNYNKAQTKQ